LASPFRLQAKGDLPQGIGNLLLGAGHGVVSWTRDRRRWGERIVIRRPVASLTASRRVLALDQRVAGTRTISTTRTRTIRPLTFAV
jgi:hypothetical protein